MKRRQPVTAATLQELADRWGVSVDTAALFGAKSAAVVTSPEPEPSAGPRRPRPLFRGGRRVRELRQALRLTRLMLARQQAARGLTVHHKLHLVGGRELRERLADLGGGGNPFSPGGRFRHGQGAE